MSIFVSTTYFGDNSKVQDALKELYSLGIKKIELGSNHSPVREKEILQNNRGKEYIVHNYFPPKEKDFILNIASSSPLIREKSIKFIKNTIKWCQKNHIKYYTIHPGFFAEAISPQGYKGENRNFDLKFSTPINRDRQKTIDETTKVIKDLYAFAEKQEVQLLIENEGSKTSPEFVIFATYEELDALSEAVGSILKFNFNLAHATLAGIDLTDKKTFLHFYRKSVFFEVSEIKGDLDSHLPISSKGPISSLVKKYKNYFRQKNIILEYRNVKIEAVKKSYSYVSSIIKP